MAGVDEADFVKNDGTRIFVLSGEKLYAAKSWPAEQTAVQGTLKIEGWPREMFLDGADTAVVFSSVYHWYPLSNARGDACSSIDCGYYSSNTVKVTVVDVSDMTNLRVKHEYYLPGDYDSARKVGRSVRLVLSRWLQLPLRRAVVAAEPHRLERQDGTCEGFRRDHREQRAGDSLADARRVGAGGHAGAERPVDRTAARLQRLRQGERADSPGHGFGGDARPRLGSGAIGRNSIIAEPGEIYASAQNLYMATRHWWWWPAPGQNDTTYMHKFDISQPRRRRYVASGTVDGHIVDQFSMDENAAGYFRMATTIQTRVPDPANPSNWWGRPRPPTASSCSARTAGSLDVVGTSEELAPGRAGDVEPLHRATRASSSPSARSTRSSPST